ncbi:MAG TPA: hypothetical protein VLG40_04425 [Candidatus Saccharimonas sp.]|nr:hypothetical protein [Candidatus Saccharimonas sp.]
MDEIKHRLWLPKGSPINPEDVLLALQSAREGRTVLPTRYQGGITLYPYDAVPVPMYVWVKVAWMPTDLLGIKWQTRLALTDMRIFYVGTLLLYTEEELAQRCNARAMKDVKFCLSQHGLRLPTATELATAKAAGFWVELPERLRSHGQWNLRVATTLAPLESTMELGQLRGIRDGFFTWAQMVTLGDILKKTEDELRQLWRDYVIDTFVCGDAERKATLPEEMRAILLAEAETLADATIGWVASTGLKFAKQ